MVEDPIHRNEARDACAFSPEDVLARYAVTGTFRGTFYAAEAKQLERVCALASTASSELVAKAAVYCREHGRITEVPALLVAHLAARDTVLMSRVFPRVIDDGLLLRSFVQFVRSGVTGRKSFGSAPKRALRAWFQSRSPETVFRQSVRSKSPSMSDVIKMVRPPPRNDQGEADAVREALYGYLIGKNVDKDKLPALARAFEAWKRGTRGLPDVPFEMFTAMPLGAGDWKELAKRMTANQLRQHLNTLLRQGVLDDPETVDSVATRLEDRDAVRRARTMPYDLLVTSRSMEKGMPTWIVNAMSMALELAMDSVPEISGHVVVCADVSGSMQSRAAGRRGNASTNVRCIDVAALVTTAILRKNPSATLVPFSDDVVALRAPFDPRTSLVKNAEVLASLSSGGTTCAAPLRWLDARRDAPDVVVLVSDDQSWSDFRLAARPAESGAAMAEVWQRLRGRNPKAKLILIDVQPDGVAQPAERDDVLCVRGFSDAVFDVIAAFTRGELAGDGPLHAVDAVAL